ncbi:hypothetical protein [Natronorubrum thiooxidans]|nr:hypothetical protein [Natronorubrum thiooxidans]
MSLLWRYLEPEDLGQAASPDGRSERIKLRKAFQDTVALTVQAIDHANDDKPLRIGVALGQAGAADQFDASKDGIHWKTGVQDSIPNEFILEYPPGTVDEPLSFTDDEGEDPISDDSGVGYPNRVEWDTKVSPSPSQLDEPHPSEGTVLETLIDDAYLEYGYMMHERLIQDRSVSPEVIAEAYNEASLGEISTKRIRRERRAWEEIGLKRPIFFYPMYRKQSSSSEDLFDEMVWSPWWEDRIIGSSSDYFE